MKLLILYYIIFLNNLLICFGQYSIAFINETEWKILNKELIIYNPNYNNKYCYYLNLFCK
jgi:hypothetical protein